MFNVLLNSDPEMSDIRAEIWGKVVLPTQEEIAQTPGRDCYSIEDELKYNKAYTLVVEVVCIVLDVDKDDEDWLSPEHAYLKTLNPGSRFFLRMGKSGVQIDGGDSWHDVRVVISS